MAAGPESPGHPPDSLSIRWFFQLVNLLLLLIPSFVYSQSPQPQVLILSSYHPGYDWSDKVLAGLLARLYQDYPNLDPAIEYLDVKRFPGQDQADRLQAYLADKYRGRKTDMVIVLDNPALNLALQHRQEIWPGVPLVFAGINNFTPAMLQGQEKVTGVAELEDLAGTLKLALFLHPVAKEVLVIHDYTATGVAIRHEIEAMAPAFHEMVKISFTPPATFQAIVERLKSLPPGSLGLIAGFATDSRGDSLSLAASTHLLAAVPVPLYAMHENRLGHGIVGGRLLSGHQHGAEAANIALRILKGTDPASIPVTKTPSQPMFDYQQLLRFELPLNRLAEGSIIINRTISLYGLYEQNKPLVLAALAVTMSLSFLAVSLIVIIIRRRQAEKKLQESEERYRRIVETANEGIWAMDKEYRTTYVNEIMVELLGYTPAEMLGQPITVFMFQEDLEGHGEKMTRRRQGFDDKYERRFRRQDGAEVWTIVSARALVDDQGNFQGSFGMLTDITERRQMEQAVRESEEKYRRLMETANDAIFTADMDTGIIIDANQKAAELTGLPVSDIIGRHQSQLHPTAERERYRDLFQEHCQQGGIISDNVFVLHADSRQIPVEISASTTEVGGRHLVYGIFRDITARKQAEEQILASLHEKEVLLKEIHHRVKNNLQIISTLLSLQVKYGQSQDPAEVFQDCQNRIRSMALIHESLYSTENLAKQLGGDLQVESNGGTSVRIIF